ncbi:pseudouridine synthase [Parapusillimonas granuli]|uniref:Pseudouridine synthase n=1 Tax=Parapusillimonas granuli TaxID=380911 RepID=A0A853FSC1_9BURK|nr:pseudouridine synthase [Parapusillimonas granuli]MBB5214808.1 tRNA pseudouridine32 synthase/23S rRNA pseudouridine746 synthase [Parapusillimonas granuli]NYT48784.1 pseudouridine synthase [Parapusillimonas granuli]
METRHAGADAAAAPLPVRDGVGPSRVYLPDGPWRSLLDFLAERFPHVPPEILRERLARGDIVDRAGRPQRGEAAYAPGRWLWYYREVPGEAPLPFDLPVLFRDEHLVAVDKPHFLASTPGGRYLRETALTRLRRALDMPWLTPLHRLDRETAGVLLFCAHPDHRGAYQSLFQSRRVFKEYEAVAPLRAGLEPPALRRSRLEQCPGQFTMREVDGPPNSETRIELMRVRDGLGWFRLMPLTGRKHQLRVHMSALGMPICNDGFYPVLRPRALEDDFSRPLRLLARAIEFVDPLSGARRRFESLRRLEG